jgi:glycosyltransferase involved in cell wall biosynthesis
MLNLNIQAPICHTGYGQVGYNLSLELSKIANVTIFPIGPVQEFPQSNIINNLIIGNKNIENIMEAPSIKIWHQNDLFSHISRSQRVGFPIFELDRFSDIEIMSLKSCDVIYVCSKWAQNIIHNHLPNKNVVVVPLGVDTDIFYPSSVKRKNTIFLNCGKWEIRKGHDVLLHAFNKAFSPKDNVELWMMCENMITPQVNNEWIKLYKESPLGNKVRIIPYQQSHIDVANIMKQADCGVFPARAEGWNLELLEMMACGKNVITTNYAGHTEFCNNDNSRLIEITETESAYDGIWFNHQGSWASIKNNEMEALITHMRNIHNEKLSNGYVEGNISGIMTSRTFSWKNSAFLASSLYHK